MQRSFHPGGLAGPVFDGGRVPARSFVRGMPASVAPLSETTIDPDVLFKPYRTGEYTNLAQRQEGRFR
jgi:hypothetical protein